MLKYIFHLSDLHIRNGDINYSRFQEYKDVFTNTISSLNFNIKNKNLNYNEFIIIITGDIFHNKNNIGNYGLLLYKNFITDLTNIGKVIILHGNHDKLQSDINQPSLVFSTTFQIDNLIILNETKSFIIDDIGFSYVSVDDTLDFNSNSGRLSNLPSFPIINGDVKFKIALFHGTFTKSKLYNGDTIHDDNNPYPLEWVKDFDYVLLGDIHKRQVAIYNQKTYYGYSGSLIQQNFGEDIIDHGYLIWDLFNHKINDINVFNNIGYINIKQNDDGQILIRINGKYDTPLDDLINTNINIFPKILEIKTFSSFNFDILHNLLTKYHIKYSIISRNTDKLSITNDFNDINNNLNYDNVANDTYILSYFNNLLSSDKYTTLSNILNNKDTLLFNIDNYPDDLKDECSKKNKEIYTSIASCNKSLELTTKNNLFIIKYLEWEGLLCYQNKNCINFNDLDSKTFMVKGKNGTGKSAIYDILLLAIWGDNTKMKIKGNTSLSAGMINKYRDKGRTSIDIELNGKLYRIEREFKKKSNTLHNYHSYIYEFINPKDVKLIKKESACNEEIKKLFGTIDDFLTTSMITQNVDNDIIKLDSKKCLELIDKSYNIDYIYNLYNMFKITINKYRDLYKTIETKKQVYQKLVSSNIINDIDIDIINDKNKQLTILNDEKNILLDKFNSITIDIRNPKYITILNTDYDTLIKSIIDIYGSFNDDDMIIKKNRYFELKNILKDIDDLSKLNSLYTDTNKNFIHINKPCDISVLHNEELQLKQYLNTDYSNYHCDDISIIENDLIKLKDIKKNLEFKNTHLISSKPLAVDNPNISINICNDNILKYFNSIDEFNNFINDNKPINLTINYDFPIIHYDTYTKLINDKLNFENSINNYSKELLKLDNDFKTCFDKQQSIITVNKPADTITKNISISTISKELTKYNIDKITTNITTFNDKLTYYNNIKNTIDELELSLDNYNNELKLLLDNDDYKFNPKCKICCSRPWVNRINELKIIINTLNNDIKTNKNLFSLSIYNTLLKNIDSNNNKLIQFNLLTSWFNYLKYKEEYDTISEQINSIIANKNSINNDILSTKNSLNDLIININNFNIFSYDLFNTINNIHLFDKFTIWNNNYNDNCSSINKIDTDINDLLFKLDYNKNIKPRIDKYNSLKKLYDEWSEYDMHLNIIRTRELFDLKNIIDDYDKYIDYINCNNLKPLIIEKNNLNDIIKTKDKDIKDINDYLIKFNTLNSYNIENKNSYSKLFDISNELNIIIDTIDTIIINFQSFRIDLYKNHILNNLVSNANSIIKKLCHTDTKPFKLDYMLNVSKDIIHINWLISNDVNDTSNNLISISQSSGFQHFTISTALRMCLFLNSNSTYCNQLFIDEGFVSFDKFNLSIVPSFLKNLLSYFNSVIIVSHIDLIQDNIDDHVSIINSNNISSIKYGDFINITKTRTRILS